MNKVHRGKYKDKYNRKETIKTLRTPLTPREEYIYMDTFDNDYTKKILACAYAVHTELGPGLLESVYEKALVYELRSQGFKVDSQVKVPVIYKGKLIDDSLRLDIIVDDKIIIELKAQKEIQAIHMKQLLTYLRLTHHMLGYIINFDVISLKTGIKRVINTQNFKE